MNGRITPEYDNYTFIEPSRGRSVVDYFVTSHADLQSCESFRVLTAKQLIDEHCVTDGISPKFIPDHSLLLLKVSAGFAKLNDNMVPDFSTRETCDVSSLDANYIFYKVIRLMKSLIYFVLPKSQGFLCFLILIE